MPLIEYQSWRPDPASLALVNHANAIILDYAKQGYDLTLRQLYYQFVSRDLIPNTTRSYQKLGGVISRGRRAGLIDWEAIVDRTRRLRGLGHWDNPGDFIEPAAYNVDRWEGQPHRVEVWIEKDALAGVFSRVCNSFDVPYLSCRGYTSDSEIWGAANRLSDYAMGEQEPIILHFGDHDPSGIDMTRDIEERIQLLGGPQLEVRRLALNMDQVRQHKPPPNPAKDTDARFKGYVALYGHKSYELDALNPTILATLVRNEITSLIEPTAWAKVEKKEAADRKKLTAAAKRLRK